ncbi:MAG TPA: hypothetical protein VIN65_06980 [Candidatus Dormibacteraeota bacterium]
MVDAPADDEPVVVLAGGSPTAVVVGAAELVELEVVVGAFELEELEVVAGVVDVVELEVVVAVGELVELEVVIGAAELVALDDCVVFEPVLTVGSLLDVVPVSELVDDVVGALELVALELLWVVELVVGVEDVVELVVLSMPRNVTDSEAACDSWSAPWLKKMSFFSLWYVSCGPVALNLTS